MKILKRLRNIWKLGENSPQQYFQKLPHDDKKIIIGVDTAYKGDMLAQIISMKPQEDEIEELLKDNQEKKDDNN